MSLFRSTHSTLSSFGWFRLSALTGVTWSISLFAYMSFVYIFKTMNFVSILLLFVGIVFLLVGLFLTLRLRYEIIPSAHYVIGSFLSGFVYAYVIWAILYASIVLNVSFNFIVYIFILGSICSSFLRKYELTKKISRIQLVGLLLVFLSTWFVFGMPTSLMAIFSSKYLVGLSIFVALVLSSFLYHRFSLDVLSPWVLYLWRGVAIVLVSIALALYAIFEMKISLLELLSPFSSFAVILFIVVAILDLLVIFFKHKTRMSQGYIAYKEASIFISMAFFTVIIDLIFQLGIDLTFVFASVVIIFALLLIEERLLGIFGAVD